MCISKEKIIVEKRLIVPQLLPYIYVFLWMIV